MTPEQLCSLNEDWRSIESSESIVNWPFELHHMLSTKVKHYTAGDPPGVHVFAPVNSDDADRGVVVERHPYREYNSQWRSNLLNVNSTDERKTFIRACLIISTHIGFIFRKESPRWILALNDQPQWVMLVALQCRKLCGGGEGGKLGLTQNDLSSTLRQIRFKTNTEGQTSRSAVQ